MILKTLDVVYTRVLDHRFFTNRDNLVTLIAIGLASARNHKSLLVKVQGNAGSSAYGESA